MKLRRRSFCAATGWSFARAHAPRLGSFRQNAAPLAVMLRSIAAEPERRRFHGPSPLRCVLKHAGVPVLILRDTRTSRSNFRHFLRMRAPQDEDGQARSSSPNRFSVVSISRCQTAHLVPAARFLRPGFLTFASLTRIEGERSAERRSGACEAPVGHAVLRQRRA
jgi:hypothetical protein